MFRKRFIHVLLKLIKRLSDCIRMSSSAVKTCEKRRESKLIHSVRIQNVEANKKDMRQNEVTFHLQEKQKSVD